MLLLKAWAPHAVLLPCTQPAIRLAAMCVITHKVGVCGWFLLEHVT